MRYSYNNPVLKPLRRELRKRQTEAERQLWRILRNRQVRGLKFYRQYSVGPYILDFFCPEKRLAIELDGSHHTEGEIKTYDGERTRYLESKDIRVLRIWNREVLSNLEDVSARIAEWESNGEPPLSVRGG